jgi:hypothetical protein
MLEELQHWHWQVMSGKDHHAGSTSSERNSGGKPLCHKTELADSSSDRH